jgi:predicted SnoaL-like aldol condensation-catalyzing enzyme
MVDGATEAPDHELTEINRIVVLSFVEDVLIHGPHTKIDAYVNQQHYTEHNPRFGDDLFDLCATQAKPFADDYSFKYEKCHRLLAEGNFVLSVCEGCTNQTPSSFFDLYRLEDGKIIEHWDTTEVIPPRSEWKNNNGKF